MKHIWEKKRPLSAWYPARYSEMKAHKVSRTHIPIFDHDKCIKCNFCWIYCPEGCITREGGIYEANLDYCKGCGLCARECPRDAITMTREEDC